MDLLDRIKALCKENHVSQRKLEQALGFGNGAITKWKSSTPSVDSLQKVANYFNVSLDYLRTGNPSEKSEIVLTKKDERDIANDLENALSKLSDESALMFDGEPLDEETRELLRISLENQFRMAKILAKEKYTPKKYRKNPKG